MRVFLSIVVIGYSSAFGQANIREASQSQVNSRTGNGYVSARRLPAGIGSVVAEGNSVDMRTNGSIYIPELSGRTNFWNVMNYGAASYPADSTDEFQYAATNTAFAAGTVWFPRGVYGASGTVAFTGGLAAGLTDSLYDYGNFKVLSDGAARVYFTGHTNFLWFTNSLRKVTVSGPANLNGTNSHAKFNTEQIGVAFAGPTGGGEMRDMAFQELGIGYVLNDITGFTVEKSVSATHCFIGAAIGYKPDDVTIRGRYDKNRFAGLMTQWTNSWARAVGSTSGNLVISATFGNNTNAAIIHPRGPLTVRDSYFESNGPDTNNFVFLQVGMDASDAEFGAYEQTFTNVWGTEPQVLIDGYNSNWKHACKVYRYSRITFQHPHTGGSTAPWVHLLNEDADNSVVKSSAPMWVTNSATNGFYITDQYYFASNALVKFIVDGGSVAQLGVTNLVSIPTAWTGTTNTLNLSGGYQYYASANDVAITNLSGMTAGEANWTTLRISNSAASAIVVRNTVGSTVRLQGTGSTNALTIPAAKVGFLSWLFAGDTNLWTTVQQ